MEELTVGTDGCFCGSYGTSCTTFTCSVSKQNL